MKMRRGWIICWKEIPAAREWFDWAFSVSYQIPIETATQISRRTNILECIHTNHIYHRAHDTSLHERKKEKEKKTA